MFLTVFKSITINFLLILLILIALETNATTQQQSWHYRNAEIALANGDTDQAGTDLKLALQANPLDSKAHYMLASLLASQGEEDQAMVGFQRSIVSDPTNPQALYNLGTLLLQRDEAVLSAQLLEQAVELNPDKIPPYNNLAKAYYLAGLPELAIATYEEVLRRDAENTVASQNLALILANSDIDNTKEMLERLPEEFKARMEASKTGSGQQPPPAEGSATPPAEGSATPPAEGSVTPPAEGSVTPPAEGSVTPPAEGSATPPAPIQPKPEILKKLLLDLPDVKIEQLEGMHVLTGTISGPREQALLTKITTKWPNILNLTKSATVDLEILRTMLSGLPDVKIEEYDGLYVLAGTISGPKEQALLTKIITKWPSILNLTKSDTIDIETLRKMLQGLPYITVENHDGMYVLTGWTRGPKEQALLTKITTKWPNILNLTVTDSGDPQRMIEVDATMFVVIGQDSSSVGFNFLQQINLSYTYFSNSNPRNDDWKGLNAKAFTGNLINLPSYGGLFIASVDYDVNIANVVDEKVAVLARPHLTTLNGTPAYFLAGGEFVFKVSGLETGTIKPYPFGTSLTITPTLLRTPSGSGVPRIHLDVQAQRTSVLEFLAAQSAEDQIVFDKLLVNSQAVVDLGQTLILSGLNQRESRTSRSGVPILKDTPLIKYLFSQTTTVDVNTAIIILLTPRDPAYMDERNRRNLSEYVQQRRDFITAKQGSEEDVLKYYERYPDWQNKPPNRFASHFFLLHNSELYRSVSREDLIEEDLDLGLLGETPKSKKKK